MKNEKCKHEKSKNQSKNNAAKSGKLSGGFIMPVPEAISKLESVHIFEAFRLTLVKKNRQNGEHRKMSGYS